MTVKYYVRPERKESGIIIFFSNGNSKLKITTEHVIETRHWDSKIQQAKKSLVGHHALNESLYLLKQNILQKLRELSINDTIDLKEISPVITKYVKTGDWDINIIEKKQNLNRKNLVDMINQYLNYKFADYKPETQRKYQILSSVLKDYQKHIDKVITIHEIDFKLLENFRQYLLTVRCNRNDTVYKMLASLKCVIRWLMQCGHSIDPKCLDSRQTVKEKQNIIILNDDEIKRVSKVELNAYLAPIRDCFLFQYYTAQRFSDMQQLSPDQIINQTWHFTSIKTTKEMNIPLVGWCKPAHEIAVKYGFQLPQYTSQYFNRALRQIMKEAGVIEKVKLIRYRGSNQIVITKPKYELVSSHSARRSAVSALLAKGVPPTVVMKMTGHSSIRTMMRYEHTSYATLHNALLNIV